MSSPYADENFFRALLSKAVAGKASDVHIKVGQPPGARIRGEIVYFRTEKIAAEDARGRRAPRDHASRTCSRASTA